MDYGWFEYSSLACKMASGKVSVYSSSLHNIFLEIENVTELDFDVLYMTLDLPMQ